MTSKKKLKNYYTSNQLAEYFRNIAAKLDGTSIENLDDQMHCFDEFTSMSLKIKRRINGYSVKVKVKTESSDIDNDKKVGLHKDNRWGPGSEVSFKHLKKRMKSTFKIINKDLVAGRIPSQEVVESFIVDTHDMGKFPEKCGDPFPEFKMTCARLLEAVDESDLLSLKNCYADLKRLRDECHRTKS